MNKGSGNVGKKPLDLADLHAARKIAAGLVEAAQSEIASLRDCAANLVLGEWDDGLDFGRGLNCLAEFRAQHSICKARLTNATAKVAAIDLKLAAAAKKPEA